MRSHLPLRTVVWRSFGARRYVCFLSTTDLAGHPHSRDWSQMARHVYYTSVFSN